MRNKVTRDKSRLICMSDKPRFLKQKHIKKSSGNNTNHKILISL